MYEIGRIVFGPSRPMTNDEASSLNKFIKRNSEQVKFITIKEYNKLQRLKNKNEELKQDHEAAHQMMLDAQDAGYKLLKENEKLKERFGQSNDEYHKTQIKELTSLGEKMAEALEGLGFYFVSGNDIPIERATILTKSDEVEEAKQALKAWKERKNG